jgi:hypothetical protein
MRKTAQPLMDFIFFIRCHALKNAPKGNLR